MVSGANGQQRKFLTTIFFLELSSDAFCADCPQLYLHVSKSNKSGNSRKVASYAAKLHMCIPCFGPCLCLSFPVLPRPPSSPSVIRVMMPMLMTDALCRSCCRLSEAMQAPSRLPLHQQPDQSLHGCRSTSEGPQALARASCMPETRGGGWGPCRMT